MKETNCYTIYSLRVAGLLMARGHNLIGMKQNKKDEGKNVFFFSNTDQFKKDLKEIKMKTN